MKPTEYIEKHERRCNELRSQLEKELPGPWLTEPNRFEWKYAGLNCLMVRSTGSFSWCGYVGVGPNHPAFNQNCDDVTVEVHGGLTYGEHCQGPICHVPGPGGDEDHLFWLGFDCAHAFDLSPSLEVHRKWYAMAPMPWMPKMEPKFNDHYWTFDEVKAEVQSLAQQLSKMKAAA